MNNREMLEALHALSELASVKMPIKTGLKVRAAMRSLSHLNDAGAKSYLIAIVKEPSKINQVYFPFIAG